MKLTFDKLQAHLLRSLARKPGGLNASTKTRIVEDHYAAELRNHLFENFHALGGEIGAGVIDACEPSSRSCEAIHEPNNHGIGSGAENDRDFHRRAPCCYGTVGGCRIDQMDLFFFETPRSLFRHLGVAFPISDREDELFSLCESELFESDPEPVDNFVPSFPWHEDTDPSDLLLRH